jgi:hypothetical protein
MRTRHTAITNIFRALYDDTVKGTILASLLFFLPQTYVFGQEMQMRSNEQTQQASHTFWGQPEKLGAGEIRTFISVTPAVDTVTNYHAPATIGVELDATSLSTLPNTMTMLLLDFPIQAARTPFQFMMIGWHPHGHPPAGIYDKPHFDFHFFIQDRQDALAIRPGSCAGVDCTDYRGAVQAVPAQYVPSGYTNIGLVAPFMGNHLVDLTSPEWNGRPFTRTILVGAYHGGITFLEPMITLATLTSEPNSCSDLRQPASYAKAAYYPLRLCTHYDETTKKYRVYLEKWVYRSLTQ